MSHKSESEQRLPEFPTLHMSDTGLLNEHEQVTKLQRWQGLTVKLMLADKYNSPYCMYCTVLYCMYSSPYCTVKYSTVLYCPYSSPYSIYSYFLFAQ